MFVQLLRSIDHTQTATVGGKKSVGNLIDELWLMGKQPDAENMLVEALGGLASRPEGFVIYLTTQSDDPPAGVFKKKLQYARGVRDGRITDPRFVSVIYEFPDDMIERGEHLDPENLALVNPNLGYSVDREFLSREFAKAKESGQDSLRGFLAKHGNVEIGLNLRSDRWPGAEFWERNGAGVTLDLILERCDIVEVGIDGGGLDDMLGLNVLGREMATGRWLSWAHAWLHPIALERRKENADRYRDFEREGSLTIVTNIGDDVEDIAAIVVRIANSGRLDKIGVDPAGVGAIVDALKDAGIDTDKQVLGISQGWRMNGAIKTAERKLAEGALKHEGSTLMAWCVGNAKIEPKGNAVSITKAVSGSGKIDPLMALFNAVSLMGVAPAANVIGPGYELMTV